MGELSAELGRELGAGGPAAAVAWEPDPRGWSPGIRGQASDLGIEWGVIDGILEKPPVHKD